VDIQIASDPTYSSHKVLVSAETWKIGMERYDIEACKWSVFLASGGGRTNRRLRSLSSAWQPRLPIHRSRSQYPVFILLRGPVGVARFRIGETHAMSRSRLSFGG
jgi:hypothetical protein